MAEDTQPAMADNVDSIDKTDVPKIAGQKRKKDPVVGRMSKYARGERQSTKVGCSVVSCSSHYAVHQRQKAQGQSEKARVELL